MHLLGYSSYRNPKELQQYTVWYSVIFQILVRMDFILYMILERSSVVIWMAAMDAKNVRNSALSTLLLLLMIIRLLYKQRTALVLPVIDVSLAVQLRFINITNSNFHFEGYQSLTYWFDQFISCI